MIAPALPRLERDGLAQQSADDELVGGEAVQVQDAQLALLDMAEPTERFDSYSGQVRRLMLSVTRCCAMIQSGLLSTVHI